MRRSCLSPSDRTDRGRSVVLTSLVAGGSDVHGSGLAWTGPVTHLRQTGARRDRPSPRPQECPMLLAGKSIVVTGGNSGIGESIVLAAAAEGANVVVDYVSHPEETTALIARVEAAGGRAVGVRVDVSRVADLHAMIQTAVDTYGRLDVLINNAGIETRTSLLDTPRPTSTRSWPS